MAASALAATSATLALHALKGDRPFAIPATPGNRTAAPLPRLAVVLGVTEFWT